MDSPAPHVSDLVARFVSGDESAGNEICNGLVPTIRAAVRRTLSIADPDSEDIVQDSLVAVIDYLRRTRTAPDNVEAFATTIARNRCLNLVIWRRRRQSSDVERFADRIPDVAASPLEMLEDRDRRELLDHVIAKLDGPCRTLLRAIYREELSIEALRVQLDLKTVQAVYYRKDACIRKARKILNRQLLKSHWDERGERPPSTQGPKKNV
jgi:RNA polymerase sigma factor (sigma-70 family)